MEYSPLSYSLTKQINKIEKKNNGIYFTPPDTINKNLKLLEPYINNIKNVLEPSCGSCEYIRMLYNNYKHLEITGIELNKTIYDSITFLESDTITLYHQDYLLYNNNKLYDLIIGNPPFFVVKKNEIEKCYHPYFDGRPSIFIPFIIKSLQLLNINGILSFILPKNFLNSLYYDKTRKYISTHFKILDIVECNDKYIDTSQETILLIVQNKLELEENNNYILDINSFTILGIPENITQLKYLYHNSTTLDKLNFKVSVGTVVWNQCKDILTDDSTKTLLIYSSDIKDNKLDIQQYSNHEKKNYINKDGITEPLLLINRGYGNGAYSFNYCLIDDDSIEYLIENHLICIRYKEDIDKLDLLTLYNIIINSLTNPKTQLFVEIYFGNNAINTTELASILPIYDM